MTGFLVGTHRQVQGAKARGGTGLGKEALDAIWQDYGEILTAANVQSPARAHPKTGGRIAQTEPRRLLNRLGPHQDDVLRFTTDFTVPFDNGDSPLSGQSLFGSGPNREVSQSRFGLG